MGKGAPIRWVENRILRRHLRGRGVEIGALWRKFPVHPKVKVWYVDRETTDALNVHYSELHRPLMKPDVVADAVQLPFRPGSLDFLIASHVLEHLQFPLAALEDWYHLLAPEGALLLRIPDKRYTFDVKRARTPLTHLLQEHGNRQDFDKRAHFVDYVLGVTDHRPGTAEFEQQVNVLLEMDYSIHYHVWTTEDVQEMIRHTRRSLALHWVDRIFWPARFYRKETIVLLQKAELMLSKP